MPTVKHTASTILDYWFGSATTDAAIAQAQKKLWWSKDDAVDADIRSRYSELVNAAAGGAHDDWAAEPRGRLALILLFDQFPRNMHRDTPRAFSFDHFARELALAGIDAGADQQLRPIERVFCYLPLEHAESMELQERCVALYTALAAEVPEADQAVFAGYVDFAKRHRDIISRYGRFPHRNRILGRTSTAEETAFLQQPGSSF